MSTTDRQRLPSDRLRTIQKVSKRADGNWRARYRDHEGKEYARQFARKVDAQRWLDEQASKLVTGTHIDPKVAQITVTERVGTQSPYVATTEQVWALYDAMPAHLQPTILLGAFVGLRLVETCGSATSTSCGGSSTRPWSTRPRR